MIGVCRQTGIGPPIGIDLDRTEEFGVADSKSRDSPVECNQDRSRRTFLIYDIFGIKDVGLIFLFWLF